MTYGDVSDVAALTKRYTTNGSYTDSTNPTTAQVTAWLTQISAIMDLALAENGFATPVTETNVVNALKPFVVGLVVDHCHWANSAGRFFSTKELRGKSPFQIVLDEIRMYVVEMAAGLEALGALRSTAAMTDGLDVRTLDDWGNEYDSMFKQRDFNWNPRPGGVNADTRLGSSG